MTSKLLVMWMLTKCQSKRKSKYDRLLVIRLVTFLVDDPLISKWMLKSSKIKQIPRVKLEASHLLID